MRCNADHLANLLERCTSRIARTADPRGLAVWCKVWARLHARWRVALALDAEDGIDLGAMPRGPLTDLSVYGQPRRHRRPAPSTPAFLFRPSFARQETHHVHLAFQVHDVRQPALEGDRRPGRHL